MPVEIERRYLLRTQDLAFLNGAASEQIEQGYFPTLPGTSLRVRIIDGSKARITYKEGDGLARQETEVLIGIDEALQLYERCPYKLRKTRYRLERFEIDILGEPLNGIHLAEIELERHDEPFDMPDWLKGAIDVTESVNNLALAKLASRLGGKRPSKPLHEMLRPPLPLIAITGGPNSGKTTALAKLKHELSDRVRVVPEAARFLIEELGMRPDPTDEVAFANFQATLYRTQRTLEEAALDDAWSRGQRAVIADRGTLDTIAYLKEGEEEFERLTGARVERELKRYTRVIHLATAPKAHFKNDAARLETYEEACKLGDQVQLAWKGHHDLRLAKLDNWEHKLAQIREYVLAAIPD